MRGAMSPVSDGSAAEERTRKIFKAQGFQVQIPDLVVSKDGKAMCVEVKDKAEPFSPPPFWGHGLDKSQIWLRTQLLEQTGMRTYLIVYEKSGRIYGQYLDKLEAGSFFDTRKGVRIYPIEAFKILKSP